jgi:hypothetical protein|uniref:Uncharacterized protein n=1 Tax=viral metagenome TaxID=1070528 RepID=A0A6C0KJ75_9ZZZZ
MNKGNMLPYRLEMQQMGDDDSGYGYYCNPEDMVHPTVFPKKKKYYTYTVDNIADFYPADYYYDDDDDMIQEKYNDYDKMVKQFKAKAYNIFSELSFACLCVATTLCILKYYK